MSRALAYGLSKGMMALGADMSKNYERRQTFEHQAREAQKTREHNWNKMKAEQTEASRIRQAQRERERVTQEALKTAQLSARSKYKDGPLTQAMIGEFIPSGMDWDQKTYDNTMKRFAKDADLGQKQVEHTEKLKEDKRQFGLKHTQTAQLARERMRSNEKMAYTSGLALVESRQYQNVGSLLKTYGDEKLNAFNKMFDRYEKAMVDHSGSMLQGTLEPQTMDLLYTTAQHFIRPEKIDETGKVIQKASPHHDLIQQGLNDGTFTQQDVDAYLEIPTAKTAKGRFTDDEKTGGLSAKDKAQAALTVNMHLLNMMRNKIVEDSFGAGGTISAVGGGSVDRYKSEAMPLLLGMGYNPTPTFDKGSQGGETQPPVQPLVQTPKDPKTPPPAPAKEKKKAKPNTTSQLKKLGTEGVTKKESRKESTAVSGNTISVWLRNAEKGNPKQKAEAIAKAQAEVNNPKFKSIYSPAKQKALLKLSKLKP